MDSIYDKIFYGTGFGGRQQLSAARAAYLFLAWVLVPCFLMMVFWQTMVGLFFGAMLSGIGNRWNADITFRHPFITFAGDIGFEDLRVRPRDPDPDAPLSLDVRRVLIDLPNLGVLQQAAAAGKRSDGETAEQAQGRLLGAINQLDHIGLHLEGMKYDGEESDLPGMLDFVGRASAAPMEAEGCVGDGRWMSSELQKLGISNDGMDLHMTLANLPEQREVHVTGELSAPHSSRAQFEEHFRAPSMVSFIQDPRNQVASYERLEITDDGFVAARDAFCAKRDGVTREEFRERHIASIRRLMQVDGMRPAPEVETVYRQYLQHGKLVLEASPNTNIAREDYHHYSIADQAKMFNATIAAGGKPVPVSLEEVPSRAIPLSFSGSTWDLVAAESRQAAGTPETATTDAAVAAAAVAAAPKPAPAAASPAVAPAAPAVAPTSTLAQATAVTAAAPATPQYEKAPDWAIPHQTTRTTVDGRPLASSLPAKTAAQARLQPLAFEELSQHVGDRIVVTTIYGDRHEGKVEQVVGSTLRLRSSPAMGYAIVNFERSKLRSITSLE